MQLTIGSTPLPGTDGVVVIRGRRQITLEWGPFNAELHLTMDLYGPDARHIARLRRNQWTFNDHDRFEFTSRDGAFRLVDTKTEQAILAGRVVGRDAVELTHGAFCSADGHAVDITARAGTGTPDPDAVTRGVARHTIPPFAVGEIARIREDAASSPADIACPRCSQPLETVRDPKTGSVLVTCPECPGNLVIERRP